MNTVDIMERANIELRNEKSSNVEKCLWKGFKMKIKHTFYMYQLISHLKRSMAIAKFGQK